MSIGVHCLSVCKGFFQISAYMVNEQNSEDTLKALNEKGFTTLAVKESLMDSTNGLGEVLDIMAYGRLALEFIILLLIAYIVIRLIMRSRNSYYSTLRILGASKGNITSILRTELILMMLILILLVLDFIWNQLHILEIQD